MTGTAASPGSASESGSAVGGAALGGNTPDGATLNQSQRIRLVATCQHVEQMLVEVERSFIEARSSSPFNRYVNDLVPADRRLVQDYAARIRAHLVGLLAAHGLAPTPERIGLRHWLLVELAFVDTAVDELEPRYMAGYGELGAEAVQMLNGIVEELHDAVAQLRACLALDASHDIAARVQRLGVDEHSRLAMLAELIARYGLVEYRPALEAALDTLERHGLELALFGRVNAGKSSLLNRLLDGDVLPVGVEPVTALPTRMRYGAVARLLVEFAGEAARELAVGQLLEYASEQHNPGNRKRVTRLTVELPVPSLRGGVVLVDTPGFGALAAGGTAETLTCLPYCDVAAVLVDASSTLTAEDVAIIRALLAGGIEVSVLLSKAELLTATELEVAMRYAAVTLQRELGRAISVTAISARAEPAGLFETWRRQQLDPLLERQQQERRQSAERKLALLQGRIEASLRRQLERRENPAVAADGARPAVEWVKVLQSAAGNLTAAEQYIDDTCLTLRRRAPEVLGAAALLVLGGQALRAALEQTFERAAHAAAGALGGALGQLSDTLKQAMHEAARLLAAVPPSEAAGMGSDIDGMNELAVAGGSREAPIPELPRDLVLPRIGAAPMFGQRLARTIIARRLRRTLEREVASALESYAAVLRCWGQEQLLRIRGSWLTATDALRAQADRAPGVRGFRTIEVERIRADLECLVRP